MSNFKKVLLAACVFVVSIVLMELILRPLGFSARLPVGRLPRYYLKADPKLSYDIQKNAPPVHHYVEKVDFKLWGNELGCYDDPYEGEPNPVVLVGDSFAHQYGPYETKWGTVLQNYIGRRILKCGVMGYGTRQQLMKAENIINETRQSPSMIIVSYYSNDVRDDYLFPRYDVVDGYFIEKGTTLNSGFIQRTKWWLHENSVIYKTLRDSLKAFLKGPAPAEGPEGQGLENEMSFLGIAASDSKNFDAIWNRHLDEVRGFKTLAQSKNARLLFVIVPDKQLVYDYLFTDTNSELTKKYLSSRREIFLAFLRRQGIPYVDLLPAFREHAHATHPASIQSDEDLFWSTDIHYSIKGERLAALVVANYILNNTTIAPERTAAMEKVKEKLISEFPQVHLK